MQVTFISLVLFSACGVLLFCIVFILVKRQIRRVTLKNKWVRHVPAGTGAPKAKLKAELDRRLARTAAVQHEPKLVLDESSSSPQSTGDYEHLPHLYRMVAVNAVLTLLDRLRKCNQPAKPVAEDLESYLSRLDVPWSERLRDGKASIERLAGLHRHACHSPKRFTKEHYDQVLQLVTELTHAVNSAERSSRISGITAFDMLTEDVIDGGRRKQGPLLRNRILDRLPFRRWTASLFGASGRLDDYQAVGSSAESVEPAAEPASEPLAGPSGL